MSADAACGLMEKQVLGVHDQWRDAAPICITFAVARMLAVKGANVARIDERSGDETRVVAVQQRAATSATRMTFPWVVLASSSGSGWRGVLQSCHSRRSGRSVRRRCSAGCDGWTLLEGASRG